MYLGNLNKINDEKYSVGFVHYMPFHKRYGLGKTQEELEQEGILVERVPTPDVLEGNQGVLYCNPETKELWYEYEDIPKTEEEIQQELINTLGQELAQLKIQLLMGGVL